jgi:hypothetical protein
MLSRIYDAPRPAVCEEIKVRTVHWDGFEGLVLQFCLFVNLMMLKTSEYTKYYKTISK